VVELNQPEVSLPPALPSYINGADPYTVSVMSDTYVCPKIIYKKSIIIIYMYISAIWQMLLSRAADDKYIMEPFLLLLFIYYLQFYKMIIILQPFIETLIYFILFIILQFIL